MYTGLPIFPGENEHEQMACIMEIFSLPPDLVLEKATRKKVFFGEFDFYRPKFDFLVESVLVEF